MEIETIKVVGEVGEVIINKSDLSEWEEKGYKLKLEAKTETGLGNTNGAGSDSGNVAIDFTAYNDEQIQGFAKQAGLPANIKKRETIIAKLTEAGFKLEAKTE